MRSGDDFNEPPELSGAWAILEGRGWLAQRSEQVRSALRSIARVREFQSGEHLYFAGDSPNGVFGLVSGTLEVSIPRADGEDPAAHRADPGFWIGDSAVLSEGTRLVSVRAVEASVTVHLPIGALMRLLESQPEMIRDFYALAHQNLQTVLRILTNLTISSSDVRVALRLLLQDEQLPAGEDWIRISQEKLAELVALSVPTLQRALRRLEESSLIESGYRRLRVADRVGLLRFCGEGSFVAETRQGATTDSS